MEQENIRNDLKNMDKPLPLWFMIILPFYIGGLLVVALFPIAGDWGWLEAWVFVITFAINMTIGIVVLNKENPRVIRNRMKYKKEGLTAITNKSAGSDRWIMPAISLGFFGALVLPAFAHRFGWPALPFGLEMVGVVLANAGVVIMNVAMLQNAYASKILDIRENQLLIDTGMYGRVRHPLYAGALLMILALPIALGSWYALLPAAFAILTLVIRIKYEEDMLEKGMDGYEEYQKRVRYKLIPGIY
jgi:protein-S-isoprenylcysteine O-methyltransferase Ste14